MADVLTPTNHEITEGRKADLDAEIEGWRQYRAALHPTFNADQIEAVDEIIDTLLRKKDHPWTETEPDLVDEIGEAKLQAKSGAPL